MAYLPGSTLPPAASDRVEFISQIHANPSILPSRNQIMPNRT